MPIDPDVLAKIGRLDLKARAIVEGFMSGMHRSPYKGYSVEFAQHRGYVPGDDLKHIDWKVWGRSERFQIKQYEAETNLVCTLLVDSSTSMRYAGKEAHGRLSKLAWSQLAAAALTYLVLNQSDAVAAGTFADGINGWVERSTRRIHLQRVVDVLEQAPEARQTGIGKALHALAQRVMRRGIVVVLSDLFDDVATLLPGLAHLRHGGHEVVVVQVLDHDELTFPFDGMIQFKGLEAPGLALCHPRSVRKAFLDEMQRHLAAVKGACQRNGIDYVQADTRMPVDVVLSAYLARREHMAAAGRRG